MRLIHQENVPWIGLCLLVKIAALDGYLEARRLNYAVNERLEESAKNGLRVLRNPHGPRERQLHCPERHDRRWRVPSGLDAKLFEEIGHRRLPGGFASQRELHIEAAVLRRTSPHRKNPASAQSVEKCVVSLLRQTSAAPRDLKPDIDGLPCLCGRFVDAQLLEPVRVVVGKRRGTKAAAGIGVLAGNEQ